MVGRLSTVDYQFLQVKLQRAGYIRQTTNKDTATTVLIFLYLMNTHRLTNRHLR
jgi:hypothetical protein